MMGSLLTWWIQMWILVLVRRVSAEPPRYVLHNTEVMYDQAVHRCLPGVLSSLATEWELRDVLKLVSSRATQDHNRSTFWVGLKKAKNHCIVPTLPLRGFRWESGGEETQMSRWEVEPKETCTTARCAALTLQFNQSTMSSWGLIPLSCRVKNPFICRHAASEPGTDTPKPHPSKSAAPQLGTAAPEPEPVLSTSAAPEAQPATPGLGTGPEQQQPRPGPESDSCPPPFVPDARFLRLDPDNSSRIRVECWSSVQLDLHCSGRPLLWRLPDDSPANISSVCLPCKAGFNKDAFGNCVDIDECSSFGTGSGSWSGPCRHTCLNTEGSYRCICSGDSQTCTEAAEDPDGGSLILIPVLVAVAGLVVLVVVVVVIMKFCLTKRSKRRTVKKAEKMVMDSKEGTEL